MAKLLPSHAVFQSRRILLCVAAEERLPNQTIQYDVALGFGLAISLWYEQGVWCVGDPWRW